jgi:uncharacterized protein (TIGR03067 family)
MHTHVWIGLAAAVLLAGDDPKEAVRQELKKFEGTWKLESQVRDGRASAPELLSKVRIIFVADGKYATWLDTKIIQRAELTVDPSKTPHTFAATITEGEVKGKSLKGLMVYGIYEFTGETRRLCYVVGGKSDDRPTEFASKPGSGRYLEVLRRVKE